LKKLFTILLFIFIYKLSVSQPIAKKGILDLINWNFDNNEQVLLNGEWEFYWNEFYYSEDFAKNDSSIVKHYINFPNYWNDYVYDNEKLSGDGFATYRLLIKIKKQDENLALKMLTVSTAYNLYVNGKKLISEGSPGKSKEEMIPAYRPVLAGFNTDSTVLEIIMHISNFHHRAGGPWQVIKFGKESTVISKNNIALAIEIFLIGSILIMALYHFGLYSIRRKEKSPLFFGLFCLVMAIRVSVTGEYGANLVYHWKWETLVFFEYLTFYTSIITFAAFINSLFPEEFKIKAIKIFAVVYAVFTSFLFFTPVKIYSHTIPYFYPFVFLIAIYGTYALILAIKRKRGGAIAFIIGFIILVSTTLNDILHQNDIIHTTNLSSAGIFGFIFVQAFLLSSRFSRAFFHTELLKLELDEININLEGTVKERTSEIQMQKEELQAQSEYLRMANEEVTKQKNDLEYSHNRITESINYAKRIQNVIIPTTEALIDNNIDHFILLKPRDIVSGDFYWTKEIIDKQGNNVVIIATADCTGHGVPGAFMSVLGITFLNEIILQQKITTPNLILNELRLRIKYALQQKGNSSETKDGMDIALCNIDKKNKKLEYSGANNPLYRIQKIDEQAYIQLANDKPGNYYKDENYFYELIVFQHNKMPIGVHYIEKDFFNVNIDLVKDDTFYIFSDGYIDQFGGELGRKFLIKNFKHLLLKISNNDLEIQKEILEETFYSWTGGNYEQIDDILVIGFKPL